MRSRRAKSVAPHKPANIVSMAGRGYASLLIALLTWTLKSTHMRRDLSRLLHPYHRRGIKTGGSRRDDAATFQSLQVGLDSVCQMIRGTSLVLQNLSCATSATSTETFIGGRHDCAVTVLMALSDTEGKKLSKRSRPREPVALR